MPQVRQYTHFAYRFNPDPPFQILQVWDFSDFLVGGLTCLGLVVSDDSLGLVVLFFA